MSNNTKRSFISDIRYFGSNIKNESDLINLYNNDIFFKPHFSKDYPVINEISGIMDGIDSRLKTRMSQLSLGIYQALQGGGALNLSEDDEIHLFTAFAEIETTDKIINDIMINESKLVSPTLFHNPVHNTPLGYFTIINKIHNYCTTISDGLETGYSFIEFINYKNLLQESLIVAAGDEYSSFYNLDKTVDFKLPPFFVSYKVTPSDKGYYLHSTYENKKDLIGELLHYNTIIVPGHEFDFFTSNLPGKIILTDYPITGDQPTAIIARLAFPFSLQCKGETAVVEYSKRKYSLFNVRL